MPMIASRLLPKAQSELAMMNDSVSANTPAVKEIDGTSVCFSFGTLRQGFVKRYEWTFEVPSVESGVLFKTRHPETENIEESCLCYTI
jgi:hypothetical protein